MATYSPINASFGAKFRTQSRASPSLATRAPLIRRTWQLIIRLSFRGHLARFSLLRGLCFSETALSELIRRETHMPLSQSVALASQVHDEGDLRAARRVLRFAGEALDALSAQSRRRLQPGRGHPGRGARPGGRQRHGQERTYRPQDCRHSQFNRYARAVRSSRRSQPWRSRRADPFRRADDAVQFRRDRRAVRPHHLFAGVIRFR